MSFLLITVLKEALSIFCKNERIRPHQVTMQVIIIPITSSKSSDGRLGLGQGWVSWGRRRGGSSLVEGGGTFSHSSNELSTSVALISTSLPPHFLVRGTFNLFNTTTSTSKHGLSASPEHLKCWCSFRFCRFEVNLSTISIHRLTFFWTFNVVTL